MSDASMQIDTDARTFRYYRHAVEKHWDPHEIVWLQVCAWFRERS